jgi:hypothetical protein
MQKGQIGPNDRGRWRCGEPAVDQTPQLSTVRRIPRGQLRPGTVVWAHIPFAEVDAEKTRPAVVESVTGRDVTLLPASSASSRHRFPAEYVELRDVHTAGLRRPTGIRRRRVTVDLIEIVVIAGALGDRDRHQLLGAPDQGCAVPGDAA